MSTRRQAREWAVQLLFQLDASARTATGAEESLDLDRVFEEFWAMQLRSCDEASASPVSDEAELFADADWRERVADRATREFCEDIVAGTAEHLQAIDEAIAKAAEHWKLDRMGGVERSALRMGAYEILYRRKEVPVPVAINEAIDVCKYFGMRSSAQFVNGVLDRIAKGASRPGSEEPEEWSPAR